MGLHQHQQGDHHQDGPIGHQLQEADAVQPLQRPAGEGAAAPLLLFLCVPLGQAGGKKQDHRHLGHLRGLELDRADAHPALHLIELHSQGTEGQHQQKDSGHDARYGQQSESLVVDLGDKEHDHYPSRGIDRLVFDIYQRVAVVVIGRGKGGGEHHDESHAQ